MAARKNRTKSDETGSKSGIVRRLWITVSMIIVIVTGYVIVRNMTVIAGYRIKIANLRSQKADYQREITADSLLIEQLKHDDYLETYARERYRMHRPDEQVFITE